MDSSDLDVLKFEKDIGVEWFKIHADQRLRMFNFFLLIAGFCIGGYFTSLQLKSNVAATTVAILLGLICIFFKLFDVRTAQLVQHGESVIGHCIVQVNEKSGSQIPNVIALAKTRGLVMSYRQTFNLIFMTFGVLSLIGAMSPWVSVSFSR